MEQTQDPWKELNKSLFTNDALKINIDTRDFHCAVISDQHQEVKDIKTLAKYKNRFFFEIEDVFKLVERLYTESGGKVGWRMLSFTQNGNWFKYLRIHKTEYGYLVGADFGRETKYFKKEFWDSATIDQQYLSTH